MKSNEFLKKYDLKGKKWNPKVQDEFLSDLTSEFLAYLEAVNCDDNITKFDTAVNMLRSKWDGISNKVVFGLPDGMWNFYYATVICKIREEVCPTEMARRKRVAEERKAERERIRQWRAEEKAQWDRWREEAKQERQRMWDRLAMAYLVLTACPITSFMFMELHQTATSDEIRAKYRELSLKMHPDRGGSVELMQSLNDAKNKCLKWAEINHR